MFKPNLTIFILIGFSFVPVVHAFDPMTVAAGAQTASTIMGGMKDLDEAADIGFALTDLLEELGVETETDEELERGVRRLQDFNSQVKDVTWAHDDLKRSLEIDLKNAKSISRRIKAFKDGVNAAKRIAAIMGVRPKAAERAVHIQEIKLSSMMLEELQSMRRAQYLAYLENREARLRREMFLQEILEDKKKKTRQGAWM